MATLTHNRLLTYSGGLDLPSMAPGHGEPGSNQARKGIRELPFETVYVFRKRIDNSRIVRAGDPHASKTCWSFLLACIAIVTLVIAVLIPGAFGMVDGYTVQALKQEQQRLVRERSVLELEEARRLSPERLEELARLQRFVDPAPDQIVYLDDGVTVAMNQAPKK